MKRSEANALLTARFEQLNKVAESIDDEKNPEALCALCDSAHKMFITLSNAGAFEEDGEEPYIFGADSGAKS